MTEVTGNRCVYMLMLEDLKVQKNVFSLTFLATSFENNLRKRRFLVRSIITRRARNEINMQVKTVATARFVEETGEGSTGAVAFKSVFWTCNGESSVRSRLMWC